MSKLEDDDLKGLHDYLRDRTAPFRLSLSGLGLADAEFAPYYNTALQLAIGDLDAMVSTDPAARRSRSYVLASYSTYRAVVDYRIGHQILRFGRATRHPEIFAAEARRISEDAKARSGVEIHPAARIGERFKIDHGVGTVIGEDVRIGARCTLMQSVVLGARGTSVMDGKRRHPTLDDDVTVCAFAMILGPISIGRGCFVGPHVVLTQSLKDYESARVQSSTMILSGGGSLAFYGIVPHPRLRRRCRIDGEDLQGWRPRIVDPHAENFPDLVSFNYSVMGDRILISNAYRIPGRAARKPGLMLTHPDGAACRLIEHVGLTQFYERL
ncbi:hypothetical protein [Zoogloea sp.]|uniref:serine O-acetyltransferase n=1 Tax=Zoogloea sp. TaxID=49181 RepID=UPI001AC1CA96|nr:hypothetical protein [Zoogloea sp.]MBN8283085.1 hypothetical protein [Zoogloea sp.]